MPDSLDLELQAVVGYPVSVLETKLGPSAKAVHTLDHRAFSPAPLTSNVRYKNYPKRTILKTSLNGKGNDGGEISWKINKETTKKKVWINIRDFSYSFQFVSMCSM